MYSQWIIGSFSIFIQGNIVHYDKATFSYVLNVVATFLSSLLYLYLAIKHSIQQIKAFLTNAED